MSTQGRVRTGELRYVPAPCPEQAATLALADAGCCCAGLIAERWRHGDRWRVVLTHTDTLCDLGPVSVVLVGPVATDTVNPN